MAEVIGAAASIVGLVDATFKVIQQIRGARDNVRAAPRTLDSVSRQLETLVQSLTLVKEEERLQTAAVEQQVRAIIDVAGELRAIFESLEAQQQKKGLRQFTHALKDGEGDAARLEEILSRLDRARNELVLRISVAQVGLMGNLSDGFCVMLDVLRDTNTAVKKTLGTDLVLADQLGARLQQTGREVPLDDADIRSLGLAAPQGRADDLRNADTSIYDNITLGQARIMTGSVGVEQWCQASGRKTTIARNRFEGGVTIMTGDMGGQAAVDFNKNFWGA